MSLTKPHFAVPSGAVDCHFHLLSDKAVHDYKALSKAIGIEKGILVQASVQGNDNAPLLKALEQLGPGFRATAGADLNLTDLKLAEMQGMGVCGVRFNLLAAQMPKWEEIERFVKQIESLNWHADFFLKKEHLQAWGAKIGALPCPLIIDHLGLLRPEDSLTPLLKLIDKGRCYVKLSALYRLSHQPFPYDDTHSHARALVKHAPERMLWGTDWPHLQFDKPMPDDGALLELLAQWAGPHTKKILADNPKALYRL